MSQTVSITAWTLTELVMHAPAQTVRQCVIKQQIEKETVLLTETALQPVRGCVSKLPA